MAGSKGGNPGQWSARKAQLLAHEYKKAGGSYKSPKRTSSQKSLSKWTKQKWRTYSGKPSLKTGERYLPDAAWKGLSRGQIAATNRAKRAGTKAGKQFVKQPPKIAKSVRQYRQD